MADVIDEKVVSMEFDNKEFEKNVAESLKSIQELKKSLDFDASTKNLQSLSQAGKRFNFSGISGAIEEVKQGFSAMEIAGITAFANIVNSAVNAGKRMVSAFTVDPVKQGFSVYEQKLNSVQTIMNNSGKTLEQTMKILESLNEYSDKTIFSLTDMTTALGKFTAAGIDAKEAVDIIKGAANEAATMGAGSAEFSRFIYNLSQAYSVGKMTMIDWKSLENAGVAGVKFKQTLVDAARELGTINDEFERKHGVVTATNLREFLKEGIITNEVMTKAFKLYANAEGYESEFGRAAEAAATQVKTFTQLLDVLKESVASQWSQTWSYIIGDFYEAKRLWTSVSTIFESTVGQIISNKKELFELWHEGFTDPETDQKISGRKLLLEGLANILLTVIQVIKPVKEAFREFFPAKTAENLWETTKAFRDFTARLKLSDAAMKQIKDAASGVFSVLKFVRTAIKDILGEIFPATKGVGSLLSVVLGLAGALGRLVKNVVETIRSSAAYESTIKAIGKAAMVMMRVLIAVTQTVYNLLKTAKEVGLVQKVFGLLSSAVLALVNVVMTYGPKVLQIVGGIAEILVGLAGLIFGGIGTGINFFKKLFSKKDGKEAAQAIGNVADSVSKLGGAEVTEAGENVSRGFGQGILEGIANVLKIVGAAFNSVIEFVKKIFGIESPSTVFIAIGAFCLAGFLIGITNSGILGQIRTALANIAQNTIIGGFMDFLKRGFGAVTGAWRGLLSWISSLAHNTSDALQGIQVDEMGVAISTDSLAKKIGNLMVKFIGLFKNFNAAALLVSGVVVAAIAVVLKIAKSILNITHFFDEVGGGFYRLTSSFNNMAKAFKRQQNPLVRTLQGIAVAIMAVAGALFILSTLRETDQLGGAIVALIGSIVIIVGTLLVAAAIIEKAELGDAIKTLTGSIVAVAAGFLILTVAFTTLVSTLEGLHGQYEYAIVAMGGLVAIGFIMYEFSKKMAELDLQSTARSVLLMISLAHVIRVMCSSLKKVSEMTDPGTLATATLSMITLMGTLAIMAFGLQNVKISSALLMLAFTITLASVVKTINSIDWDAAVAKVKQYEIWVAGAIAVASIMAWGAHVIGEGFKAFGQGMTYMGAGILMVSAALAAMKLTSVDKETLGTMASLLLEVAGLALLMSVIFKFVKPPKKDMENLIKLLNGIGKLILMLGISASIMSYSGVDSESILALGGVLIGFTGVLAILVGITKSAKNADFASVAKLVRSFSVVLLSLALLARSFRDSEGGDVAAMIFSLLTVFAGIAALCYISTAMDESAVKPMKTIVAALLVITGSLILLSMIPVEKLLYAMAGLVASILSIFLVVSAMGRLKKDALAPAIVAALMIAEIAASLVVLTKLCDWKEVLAAAGAMSATMLAVSIGLRIIAGANVANILAAAASITIAAAGLFVLAFAIKQFEGMKFDESIGVAAASFGVLVAALAALGAIGPMVLAAGGAIILGATGLVILAQALAEFDKVNVDYEKLLKTAGTVAVLGLAGVVLGAGSLGLIAGSTGLLILSAAMINFGKSNIEPKYLSKLAGSLSLLGLSGVVLGLGSVGLVAGGLALLVLSLGLTAMDNLDYKQLSDKNLSGLASGLLKIAGAGVVGIVGGPGLVAMAVGLLAIAGALMVVATALDVLYGIMDFFSSDEAEQIGENTIAGYQNGVVKRAPSMLTAVGGVFTSLISGICNILGVHSPSEVLRKIGEWTGLGFLEGWANSEFVAKLDKASAAIASEGVLKPFTSTLSNGFSGISDAFAGVFGKATDETEKKLEEKKKELADLPKEFNKIYARSAKDVSYTSRDRDKDMALLEKKKARLKAEIEALEEQLANETANTAFAGLTSIFDGLHDAIGDLCIEFPDLQGILDATSMDANGLSMDLNGLEGALGDVGDATDSTSKTFEKSISMFSEFDRALKKTVTEIESNMIDQILGTDQYTKYLKNLRETWGYDIGLIQEIAAMSVEEGYQWAAALNAAGTDEAYVQYINKMYRDGKLFENGLNEELKIISEATESKRDLANWIVTEDQRTGEYMMTNGGHTNDAIMQTLLGDPGKAASDAGAQYFTARKELDEEIKRINSKSDEEAVASGDSTEKAADLMMSEMSDAIKTAISKYLPANTFISIGENICKGLAAGIYKERTNVISDTIEFAQTLVKAVEDTFGVASPSKVFKRIGEYCTEGLAIGLEDSTDANRSVSDLGNSLTKQLQAQLAKIQALLNGEDIWEPTIRPVVDLSNVATSAEQARLMFDSSQVDAASNDFDSYRLTSIPAENTLAGMSKDEFARYLSGFANALADEIKSDEQDVNVNVYLEGETKGIFKVVRVENERFKRTAGYSALT